nr:HK97 family phage prohead protease [Brevibacillus laterosporus]
MLGSTKNETLRLYEDDIGLRFELDLPNNTWGKDAYESIQRGDVDGVSFGFHVRKDAWTYQKNELSMSEH